MLILIALLFAIFLVSFFLLSISGNDWLEYCRRDNVSKWVFPLYLLIDGNAFHDFCSNKDVSGLAVFIACLIYITGVVIFTGMIISVMTNMIERRVENNREGHIHYLESGHYIIMGYDDMVPSFVKYIFDKDSAAYVLILTSAKVYADMTYVQEDNDEVVKEFTYNLIDHIKQNIQDDSVCFVAIPPNELMVNLNGANAGGPVVLVGSNINYVFVWAIIR